MIFFRKTYVIILMLIGGWMMSQTLSSTLNKSTLGLGEAAEFKININDINGEDVLAAPKNELLPFHFEVVKDSISKQQNSYSRVIAFAVFEEGKFTIPALDIKVGNKIMKTIPYEVEVTNTAQKTDQISDIMKNKEVKLNIKDYWELYKFYILASIAVLGIIFLIIYFIKFGKKRKGSPIVTTNQTLKELERLKKKNYIDNGDYRMFYVELIEISRGFLTKQFKIPADVLLTDDLIDNMKLNNVISLENETILEDIFHRSDLVKFAKTIPAKDLMEKDFEDIKNLVKRSTKDVEAEQIRTMN